MSTYYPQTENEAKSIVSYILKSHFSQEILGSEIEVELVMPKGWKNFMSCGFAHLKNKETGKRFIYGFPNQRIPPHSNNTDKTIICVGGCSELIKSTDSNFDECVLFNPKSTITIFKGLKHSFNVGKEGCVFYEDVNNSENNCDEFMSGLFLCFGWTV